MTPIDWTLLGLALAVVPLWYAFRLYLAGRDRDDDLKRWEDEL